MTDNNNGGPTPSRILESIAAAVGASLAVRIINMIADWWRRRRREKSTHTEEDTYDSE